MIDRVAGLHERGAVRVHERGRLVLDRFLQAAFGRCGAIRGGGVVRARNIEQDDRESGGGAERGDAVPHHAGADDTDFGDSHQNPRT